MDKYKDLVEEERSPDGIYIRYNKKLGSGAYKNVYLGYDTDRGIDVAWNVINLSGIPKRERERISKETLILKSLRHPNIIDFYHVWENPKDESIVFTTEIVSSGTLKEFAKRSKDRPKLKLIKKWCRQILDVLQYLHSRSPPVIHRDLKCDNIFINGSTGELKVGDLGLSTSNLRPLKTVLGTPEFMAPEMYDEDYSELVDIYAFGMCVLELCTNKYPYEECLNPAQVYKRVVMGQKPKILSNIRDSKVRDFIMQSLAKKENRLSSKELLQHPFLNFDSLNDAYAVRMVEDGSESSKVSNSSAKYKKGETGEVNKVEKKNARKIKNKKSQMSKKNEDYSEEISFRKAGQDKSVFQNGKEFSSEESSVGIPSVSEYEFMVDEYSEFYKSDNTEDSEDANENKDLNSIVFSEDENFFLNQKKKKGNIGNAKQKAKYHLVKAPVASTSISQKTGKANVSLRMVYNDGKKRHVRFPFNFRKDTLGEIWNEMKRDLSLSERDCSAILNVLKKALIKAQKKQSKRNIVKKQLKEKKDNNKQNTDQTASKINWQNTEETKQKKKMTRREVKRNSQNRESKKQLEEETPKKLIKEKGALKVNKEKVIGMQNLQMTPVKKDGIVNPNKQKTHDCETKDISEDFRYRSMEEKELLVEFLLRDMNQKMLLYFKSLDVFSKCQLQEKLGEEKADDKNFKELKRKFVNKVVWKSVTEITSDCKKFERRFNSPLSIFAKQANSNLNAKNYYKINERNLKILNQNIHNYLKNLKNQQRELEDLKNSVKEALSLISITKPNATRKSQSSKDPLISETNLPSQHYFHPPNAGHLCGDGAARHIATCLCTPASDDNLHDSICSSINSIAETNTRVRGFCQALAPSRAALIKAELRQRKDKFSPRTSEAMKAEFDRKPTFEIIKKQSDNMMEIKPPEIVSFENIFDEKSSRDLKEKDERAKKDAAEAEERLMDPILNFKKKPSVVSKPSSKEEDRELLS